MAQNTGPQWNSYPSSFWASDASARRFRGAFFRGQRLQLGSLVLASLASSVTAVVGGACEPAVFTSVAVLLFVGLLVGWVSRAMRYEVLWFDCRAVAESVKTATWRFMMGAAPFSMRPEDRAAFVAEIRAIRKARPEASSRFAGQLDAESQEVTPQMESARSLSPEEKQRFYLENRVHDQRIWYSSAANTYAKRATAWFVAVLVLQMAGVAGAIVVAVSGSVGVDIVAVISALAAAGIAWDNRTRHTELSNSYSLAAQELTALESILDSPVVGETFAELVDQVEETISREHTLWLARRDVSIV